MESAAVADGRPPSLAITTDWGLKMTEDADGLPATHGAGGIIATVRTTGRHHVYYADGQALFLGGIYGLRVGGILGASMRGNYGEITSISQSTTGNVTTTTVTGVSYDKAIHNVMGLDVSANATSYDGTAGVVLGAGFGWMGQDAFELQGLYDVVNATPGIRINFIYALGEKDFSIPFRIGFDAFFDFKNHPAPLILTFGLGGGSGFNW